MGNKVTFLSLVYLNLFSVLRIFKCQVVGDVGQSLHPGVNQVDKQYLDKDKFNSDFNERKAREISFFFKNDNFFSSSSHAIQRKKRKADNNNNYLNPQDAIAFSNILPRDPLLSLDNSLVKTILQIVDHKFDTLSSRMSALERAINGLQYYNVRQFRSMKIESLHFQTFIRDLSTKMRMLKINVRHPDMNEIKDTTRIINQNLKRLTETVGTGFNNIYKQLSTQNNIVKQEVENIKNLSFTAKRNENQKVVPVIENISQTAKNRRVDIESQNFSMDLLMVLNKTKDLIVNRTHESTGATEQLQTNPTQLFGYFPTNYTSIISGTHPHSQNTSQFVVGTTKETTKNQVTTSRQYYKKHVQKGDIEEEIYVLHSYDNKVHAPPIIYESLRQEKPLVEKNKHAYLANRGKEELPQADGPAVGDSFTRTDIRKQLTDLNDKMDRVFIMLNKIVNLEKDKKSHIQLKKYNIATALRNITRTVIQGEKQINRKMTDQQSLLEKIFSRREINYTKLALDAFVLKNSTLTSNSARTLTKVEKILSILETYELSQEQVNSDIFTLLKSVRQLKDQTSSNLSSILNTVIGTNFITNKACEKMGRFLNSTAKSNDNQILLLKAINFSVTDRLRENTANLNKFGRSLRTSLLKRYAAGRYSQLNFLKGNLFKTAETSKAILTLSEAMSRNTAWLPYIRDLTEKNERLQNKTSYSVRTLEKKLNCFDSCSSDRSVISTLSGEMSKSRGRRHFGKISKEILPKTGHYSILDILEEYRRLLPAIQQSLLKSEPILTLVNGTTENEGRVEIFHKGVWGSICGVTYGSQEAQTICQKLGYPGGIVGQNGVDSLMKGPIWHLESGCLNGRRFDSAHCMRNSIETNSCPRTQTFAVKCEHQVRLDGYKVQVYHNNTWGSVCSNGWTAKESMVACRQLGHNRGRVGLLTDINETTGPIWLAEISCRGNELRLDQCFRAVWKRHTCNSGKLAGVHCLD